MTDKAAEIRRAYKREWNRNNPEKVKQHQIRYWEKKAREAEAADRLEKSSRKEGV